MLGPAFPPLGYAAGQVLAEAVEGTKSLDQKKLADYMHTHTFSTVVGDIAFGKDGEWAKPRVFFTQFQSLLEPGHHPKWNEVNLTAEIPGWKRFAPADQWLKRNTTVQNQPGSHDLKSVFQRFLEERLQVSGGEGMTQQQKDELFGQFQRWLNGQTQTR